ncbi:MAG: shikimate dehydrogenase [Myxococcota bacterium]
MKRVYGIIGWPVWHTRSPAMHNAAFEAKAMDAVYVPFGVRPSRLSEALHGMRALGIRGVNVTLPHKRNVVELLDEVDDDATAIGAVNTITFTGNKSIGSNTDAEGLVCAMAEHGFKAKGSQIVVVGSGGAARAAVAGFADAGAKKISVIARSEAKATKLIEELEPFAKKTDLEAFPLKKVPKRPYKEANLLVQATSATLDDGPAASKFAASLALGDLHKSALVTDVVYAPALTTVLRAAKKLGLQTADGYEMLLHQGAIAWEKWTKKKAPIKAMREAL